MATNFQRNVTPQKLVANWSGSTCVMEQLGFVCTKDDVKDRCPLEEKDCSDDKIIEWLQEECDA